MATESGWARRLLSGHSIVQHYFVDEVSVCPKHWPQAGVALTADPKGMRCPDCKRWVRGDPPRTKGKR